MARQRRRAPQSVGSTDWDESSASRRSGPQSPGGAKCDGMATAGRVGPTGVRRGLGSTTSTRTRNPQASRPPRCRPFPRSGPCPGRRGPPPAHGVGSRQHAVRGPQSLPADLRKCREPVVAGLELPLPLRVRAPGEVSALSPGGCRRSAAVRTRSGQPSRKTPRPPGPAAGSPPRTRSVCPSRKLGPEVFVHCREGRATPGPVASRSPGARGACG